MKMFRNKNCEGFDFSNQDLTGANFRGCNLRNANFSGAKLWYANFKDANLDGTIFDAGTKVSFSAWLITPKDYVLQGKPKGLETVDTTSVPEDQEIFPDLQSL